MEFKCPEAASKAFQKLRKKIYKCFNFLRIQTLHYHMLNRNRAMSQVLKECNPKIQKIQLKPLAFLLRNTNSYLKEWWAVADKCGSADMDAQCQFLRLIENNMTSSHLNEGTLYQKAYSSWHSKPVFVSFLWNGYLEVYSTKLNWVKAGLKLDIPGPHSV